MPVYGDFGAGEARSEESLPGGKFLGKKGEKGKSNFFNFSNPFPFPLFLPFPFPPFSIFPILSSIHLSATLPHFFSKNLTTDPVLT